MTISEECGEDWAFSEQSVRYDRLDKEIGLISFALLDRLSQDIAGADTDAHGWTGLDYQALSSITELEGLEPFMVPPVSTPEENRVALNERMAALRHALPFSEVERHWLFNSEEEKAGISLATSGSPPEYIEAVRRSEARLMSAGLYRVVRGRDLMRRWWSWRREAGDYANGHGGLPQARDSLHGLVQLLTPELGVPESYAALPGDDRSDGATAS